MTQSVQFLKRRRFLTVAPLLVLPFVTLAFWALGGGQGRNVTPAEQQGFNINLPDAIIDSTEQDKLSLYDQAQKDSLERKEFEKTDPYADGWDGAAQSPYAGPSTGRADSAGAGYQLHIPMGKVDQQEARVRQQLAELQQELNQPASAPAAPVAPTEDPVLAAQMQRLEAMMQQLSSPQTEDPEMNQMDKMLDKILDIQHPAAAREKLKGESARNKGKVYTIATQKEQNLEDLLTVRKKPTGRNKKDSSRQSLSVAVQAPTAARFYDLQQDEEQNNADNAVPALIHETQTLVSGSTIKMRLTKDIFIGGATIPRGTFVYGDCSVEGERLSIAVHNIRYGNNLYPVTLSAYDLDGLSGVHIPGAITRDVAKQGADQAIQSLELFTMDPSITAQAASVGVNTIKSLLSQKAKLVKVTVRGNYPVLLRDGNADN